MSAWVKKEGWLKGISAKKPKVIPKDPIDSAEEGPASQYGVIYHPLRCPDPTCRSKNIKTYATKLPVRYHICNICGTRFKSTEKEEEKVLTTP